jgi:hypothetical protein
MTGRRRIAALAGAALIAVAFFGSASITLGGISVSICHATPPDTAANGWSKQSISPSSAANPVPGHDGHAADIIPQFDFGGGIAFAGQNLTHDFGGGVTGQMILDNECENPEPTVAPTAVPTQDVEATETPTDVAGSTGSGPDGAWLLIAALGALLAGVVVLTPARARARR